MLQTIVVRARLLTILAGIALLQGCSSMESLVDVPIKPNSASVEPYNLSLHQRSVHLFDPVDINSRVHNMQLEPRIDNLFVLLDQSALMEESYRGVELRLYAQEIARRFLKTLPEHPLGGGFWVLNDQNFDKGTDEFMPEAYLKQLEEPGLLGSMGTSDLAESIDRVNELVSQKEQRSALLILTRWDRINRSVQEAVLRLRQRQLFEAGQSVSGSVSDWQGGSGQGVCVYTLGVGNRLSRTQIDQADTCGFSSAADKVAQPRDMAHFVERVLFTGPADKDADGIADYLDRCPGTAPDRIVNFNGCPQFN